MRYGEQNYWIGAELHLQSGMEMMIVELVSFLALMTVGGN